MEEVLPYHPIFYCGDLLKNALLLDQRMWQYQETVFAEEIFYGHLVINLLVMAVIYPITV